MSCCNDDDDDEADQSPVEAFNCNSFNRSLSHVALLLLTFAAYQLRYRYQPPPPTPSITPSRTASNPNTPSPSQTASTTATLSVGAQPSITASNTATVSGSSAATPSLTATPSTGFTQTPSATPACLVPNIVARVRGLNNTIVASIDPSYPILVGNNSWLPPSTACTGYAINLM